MSSLLELLLLLLEWWEPRRSVALWKHAVARVASECCVRGVRRATSSVALLVRGGLRCLHADARQRPMAGHLVAALLKHVPPPPRNPPAQPSATKQK